MNKSNKNRTKLTLTEIETQMEVLNKKEMQQLKGGGDGSKSNPYTIDEYNILCDYGLFRGGYVADWGYIHPIEGTTVTASPQKKDTNPFGSSSSFWNENYGSIYAYITSPYNGGGGGANSSSYTNNNSPQNSTFSQTISDLWNSSFARILVPDVFSLNLSTSATAIIGVSYELSINFITRGNDASLIPVITFAPGVQGGPKVTADALIGASYGWFTVTDVCTIPEGKAKGALGGWTINGVMSAGKGVGGSVNASISFDSSGYPVFFNIGVSGGASFGSGYTVGTSHTLILNQ